MGLFDSPKDREEKARAIEAQKSREDNAMRDAYFNADVNARLMAFANVYANGGQLDAAMFAFSSDNAERALRDFITLMESMK